jgi:hypothetical protein
MPQRVQLRRTKGWRKPEGVVVVDRRTRYGNPFTGDGDRALAVDRFREWITDDRTIVVRGPDGYDWYNHGIFAPKLEHLRGRDLACWCPLDQPCHADVLLEVTNA